MILLSVRAGLRAAEIANLDWGMVTDSRGRIAGSLSLEDAAAKKGGGRRVPIASDLQTALRAIKPKGIKTGPVIAGRTGEKLRPNSVVNWFVAIYADIGATGCSSHSGRRTFITSAARNAHKAGATLRDVQILAGHRSIETTQAYIEGDSDAQRRLVDCLSAARI